MNRILIVAFTFLISLNTPANAEEHRVPVSTVEELAQAIRDANDRPASDRTTIHAKDPVMVPPETDLPTINSNILLAATFLGMDDSGPKQLLKVGKSGVVDYRGRVIDFVVSSGEVDGFIENEGQLKIRGDFKLVRNLYRCGFTCVGVDTPIVFNAPTGVLVMERFIFSEEGYTLNLNNAPIVFLKNLGSATLDQVQVYLPDRNWQTPIFNSGYMRLQNVSMVNQPGKRQQELHNAIETTDDGVTESVNSVYGGFSGNWCDSTASLGYNLVDSPECSWEGEGDLTGIPTGLIWRDSDYIMNSVPSGLKSLIPTIISAAVDSANFDWIPIATRSIEDGNGDGVAQLDRGAVELRPLGLANGVGGINGLYYNPQADGHYIQIMQTDYVTLVIWNTFDQEGKPFWVYGIGELIDGSSVVAETYVHENEGSFNFNESPPSDAVYWGTIEVDMTSCTKGAVAYSSSYPGFGEGSFQIKRLAYVTQLGCVD